MTYEQVQKELDLYLSGMEFTTDQLDKILKNISDNDSLAMMIDKIKDCVAAGSDWEKEIFPQPAAEAPRKKASHKERLSIDALSYELHRMGIKVKFDVLAQEIKITGFRDSNPEHRLDVLPSYLQDQLADDYTGATTDTIGSYLNIIATEKTNLCNPMLEHLQAIHWDGKDRLKDLFTALGIQTDNLSQTLLIKWMWQGIALLNNDPLHPYGADGVLTLVGSQGIGKTTIVRKLAIKPQFFREGQRITNFDKDDRRRCITVGVCELGEIDSTFKRSDAGTLKAFITQSQDEYRLPYGRADIKAPRRTNLAATVNETNFLIDPTGNRRYWTIPLDTVDLDKLDRLDIGQIYRQIWDTKITTKKDMQTGYRLTREEQQLLAERNSNHEKPLKCEDEVRDIFAQYENSLLDGNLNIGSCQWKKEYITVSSFKDYHSSLKNYSVSQIGQALDKMGVKAERKRIGGKNPERVRELPYIG